MGLDMPYKRTLDGHLDYLLKLGSHQCCFGVNGWTFSHGWGWCEQAVSTTEHVITAIAITLFSGLFMSIL